MRDEPDARARELATRDLRVRAARGARLLRPGRRGRAVPTFVRRRPVGRRRGRTRSPGSRARFVAERAPQAAANVRTERRNRGRASNILEFGSGAAGPIATRYFVEHGATVLRVESKSRPDFLRVYALGPNNPHGLEGAAMYDGLNVGKRNVTLNLKHPDAVALVRRLVVEWADAVAENFAPARHARLRARLRRARADQARPRDGQRVPERPDRSAPRLPRLRRPGFCARGLQRAHRLGRPGARRAERHDHRLARTAIRRDRPRGRAALPAPHRAGCVPRRRRRSRPRSTASPPWLLDYEVDGIVRLRDREPSHRIGAARCVPCVADDGTASATVGSRSRVTTTPTGPRSRERSASTTRSLATLAARAAREDEVEALVAAWTRPRTRDEVATTLQAAGIEAVPVEDFGDLHDDPQLAAREHFETLEHPFLGVGAVRAERLPALATPPRATTAPARRSGRTPTGCSARSSGSTTRPSPRSGNAGRSSSRSLRFASFGWRRARGVSPSAVLGRDRYRASACRRPRASSRGCRGGCGRDARHGTASASGHA